MRKIETEMMGTNWRTAVALLMLTVLGRGITTAAKGTSSSGQVQFSADDSGVQKPVTIPEDVLNILRKDKWVRTALQNGEIPAKKLPRSWFSASAIHLSAHRRADLVVVAEGPLVGANVTTFWVFRATARGYKLVLNAPAFALTILDTRWNGYRDIELASATAVQSSTVICRFNGKKYTKNEATSQPIQ